MAITPDNNAAAASLSFITVLPPERRAYLASQLESNVLDLFISLRQESSLARFFLVKRRRGAEFVVGGAGITEFDSSFGDDPSVPSAAAYLESLNPEQRRAVEHGAAGTGS